MIGMGVDKDAHLMHRYLEGARTDAGHDLHSTRRAMVVCSLTTMLGFGSLVTAQYQALSTLGWLTILWRGFCLIIFLCFLRTLLLHGKEIHG